ncbi:Bromodomain associated-domain-containing protein [Bombardia bombarda]|uniref:Transcription initiation factor TFIID subunit 8 n=1 Tax=Bombardia bombarda TaxID=252184 RepID=A0AA40BVJ4_9PEZI|nr:Bromodomain associated-domain-containing protein [Bombardia bombarda]
MAPAPESRKRTAETQDDHSPEKKRQRTQPAHPIILSTVKPGTSTQSSPLITHDDLAKTGLRRSVALALEKVGFDSASPEAMESFVAMTDAYLSKIVEDVKTFANVARRSYPVPKDFEKTLKRRNLTTSALRPHRKPPIPRSKRLPKYEPLDIPDSTITDLPILCPELDGAADKAAKGYIPASFPSFPSIHTYKSTPEDVDNFTAADPLPADAAQSQAAGAAGGGNASSQTQTQSASLTQREIPRGDPKKIREAAAQEAKDGEQALRKLTRAAKVAKQREVWSTAQLDPTRRDRHQMWEALMVDLMQDGDKAKGKEPAKRVEIADHSMIVNAEERYYRREMPRTAAAKKVAVAGDL